MPEEQELEEFKKRNVVRQRTKLEPTSQEERYQIYSKHAAVYALIFLLIVAFFWFPSIFRTEEKEETPPATITSESPKAIQKKTKVAPPQEELDSFGWNKKTVETKQYPMLEKFIEYFKKYTLLGFIISNVDDEKVVHAFEDLSDGVQELTKSDEDDS